MQIDFLDCVHSHHQLQVIEEQPPLKGLVAPETAVIIAHRVPVRLEILLDSLALLVDGIHLPGVELLAVCLYRQGAHLAVIQYGIPIEMDGAILECKGGDEDAPAVIGEGEGVVQRLLGDLPLHIGVAVFQGYDVAQAGIDKKRAIRLAHEALVPHEGRLIPADTSLGKDVREGRNVGDAAAILLVAFGKGTVIHEGEQVDEVHLRLAPHPGVIARLCMVDGLRGRQYPVPVYQDVPPLVSPD